MAHAGRASVEMAEQPLARLVGAFTVEKHPHLSDHLPWGSCSMKFGSVVEIADILGMHIGVSTAAE